MNRLSRDAWLAIGLGVMIVFMLGLAGLQQSSGLPPYTSLSSSPNGTRALRLWLEEHGWAVRDSVPGPTFSIPADATLALLFEPSQAIIAEEWTAIDAWIDQGGTLVVAGENFETTLAFDHFDFERDYLASDVPSLTLQLPLMVNPPVTQPVTINAESSLRSLRQDYLTHLAVQGAPVLASFRQGNGQVFLSTSPYPFSNLGMKDDANSALAINLVTQAPGDAVWFDEWHHGIRGSSEELLGPQEWLFGSWGGRAFLYTGIIIFLALILQGQRFGRPITLAHERTRRAPLEYITAIANLSRRAGHRHFVLGHYHRRLKAELAHRYRLRTNLSDEDFVNALQVYNPPIDLAALRMLLAQLKNPRVTESQMVELASRAVRLLEERPTPYGRS